MIHRPSDDTDASTENPYAAPTSQDSVESFRWDPDTEFLIRPQRILVQNGVTLPEVCLHTGNTTDLEQRTQTFHAATTGLILGICAAAGVILVPLLFQLARFSLWGAWATGASLVAAVLFLLKLGAVSRRSGGITMKWYISRSHLSGGRRRRLLSTAAVVLTASFAAGAVYLSNPAEAYANALLAAIAAGAASASLFYPLSRETRLRYDGVVGSGPYKGAYRFSGHRQPFTDVVLAMIRAGESRLPDSDSGNEHT